jgi:GT2 family glycosyltransferase
MHESATPPVQAVLEPEFERAQVAVSVAICTYERYDLLEGVLRAVAAQEATFGDFEIVLVDNTPDPDRSQLEFRRHRDIARLRWVHEPEKGLSRARNRAITESTGAIIAFLDDDAVPDPGWLRSLMDAFDILGQDAMAIGGRVSPQFLGPRPAWLADALLPYLSITDLGTRIRLLDEGEWIVGANMALRRTTLAASGGFPEHLGRKGSGATLLSNDETALLSGIRDRGGLVGYAPDALVMHLIDPARLSQAWFRRRLAWQAVSDYLENPAKVASRSGASWEWLTGFLVRLPPSQRSYRGLLADMREPDLLEHQINAVYNAITCLLTGVELTDPLAPPPSTASAPRADET